MRKRRAILYDDEPTILSGVTIFFEELGYEVIAFGKPVDCPIFVEGNHCGKVDPCGDIMITDLGMPGMSGVELLQLQARRECRLPVKNKAVLTGNLDPAFHQSIRGLGCAVFLKPVRLSTLFSWIRECEERMDLSQPLGVRRRERREACTTTAVFGIKSIPGLFAARVVNKSDSGLCIRFERPLAEAQILDLQTSLSISSDRLQVRWTRPDVGGWCLAGMSCF